MVKNILQLPEQSMSSEAAEIKGLFPVSNETPEQNKSAINHIIELLQHERWPTLYREFGLAPVGN